MALSEDTNTLTEKDLSTIFQNVLDGVADEDEIHDLQSSVVTIEDYAHGGWLTSDTGFVVKLASGQEFHVTVKEQ